MSRARRRSSNASSERPTTVPDRAARLTDRGVDLPGLRSWGRRISSARRASSRSGERRRLLPAGTRSRVESWIRAARVVPGGDFRLRIRAWPWHLHGVGSAAADTVAGPLARAPTRVDAAASPRGATAFAPDPPMRKRLRQNDGVNELAEAGVAGFASRPALVHAALRVPLWECVGAARNLLQIAGNEPSHYPCGSCFASLPSVGGPADCAPGHLSGAHGAGSGLGGCAGTAGGDKPSQLVRVRGRKKWLSHAVVLRIGPKSSPAVKSFDQLEEGGAQCRRSWWPAEARAQPSAQVARPAVARDVPGHRSFLRYRGTRSHA